MREYHRHTIRLKGYDYSQYGYYFITICTYEREYLFGDIANKRIILSDIGKSIEKCLLDISAHFKHVVLDKYVIMPNHVHMILVVGANKYSPINDNYDDINRANDYLPLQGTKKTIGSIVRGFKIGVYKLLKEENVCVRIWQRNYYEHIIRNEKEYFEIRRYIEDNPVNWLNDEMYS